MPASNFSPTGPKILRPSQPRAVHELWTDERPYLKNKIASEEGIRCCPGFHTTNTCVHQHWHTHTHFNSKHNLIDSYANLAQFLSRIDSCLQLDHRLRC